MELWKTVLLGVVEGITEWLPISSTGHLLLLDRVIDLSMTEAYKEMFFVVIQLGAVLAVAVTYWKQLWPMGEGGQLRSDVLRLWGRVLVGCIPAGVLGLLLDDFLEAWFGTPVTIALMLIGYGVAFLLTDNRRVGGIDAGEDIPVPVAFGVGLFQALAMIPGTSRSGATILGGVLLGLSPACASRFSFFLALPTMLGASGLKLVKFGFGFTTQEAAALAVGMVTAFGVSMVSIRVLLRCVNQWGLKPFGWYRMALGGAVLLLFK